MHSEGRIIDALIPPLIPHAADAARHGDARALAAALADGRARTLALFAQLQQALPGLRVPLDPVLNPPLWELGHVGWFEERWIARNPERSRGPEADPQAPRGPALLPAGDRCYDSSAVPHDTRWSLTLPGPAETLDYLAAVREASLARLAEAEPDDAGLYFFRLALFHEDMHREAWRMLAWHLDLAVDIAVPQPAPASLPAGEWAVAGGVRRIGSPGGAGFAFDNELQTHEVPLAPLAIDRAAVSWRRFLPFVEAGGYRDDRLWSPAGRAWRDRLPVCGPLRVRQTPGGWQRHRAGRWEALELDAPASHLSAHEAEAWCRWAGRRLPTEAEWEHAALAAAEQGEAFSWGQVWEWTASDFAPYAGFAPHPYRDYSQPWFGPGRRVLRGASCASEPRMKHPRYRNFFPPERRDVVAGFRSVSLV